MAIDFSEPRSVAENSAPGVDVKSPVTATDADGDMLTYSVVATDATSAAAHLTAFNEDFSVAADGQISVKIGADIDFEDRSSYTVKFQVSDREDASGTTDAVIDDTLTLTVNVINVNEGGTATFTSGDPPQVGTPVTAELNELDEVDDGSLSWQWSRSATRKGTFSDIGSATDAAYTPGEGDRAFFLRATATYDDPFGSGKTRSADTSLPVSVMEHTLASNIGQDNRTAANAHEIVLLYFETGSNPAGYELSGVDFQLRSDADVNLTLDFDINQFADPRMAGPPVAALEPTTTLVAGQVNRFTVNDGVPVRLEPNTGFSLSLNNIVSLQLTVDTEEDSGTAHGWKIDDNVLYGGSGFIGSASVKVGFVGFALLGPPSPLLDLSAAAGAGEVTLSWSEPGSIGQSAITKYEVRYKVGNAAFGGWSDVPDSNADSDLGDERSVTVSGLTAAAVHTFEVRAVNTRGAGTAVQATATPLNSPPVFSATDYSGDVVARSVAENTSGGLGLAITATDGDSDTLTYSVAATGDGDAADHLAAFNNDFDLNTGSGQISVKSGVTIDFETRESYKVLYQVTDKKNASGAADTMIDDTLTLTVTVTNVNEPGVVTITGTGC